jgi:tRNA threonylcarbamoyladenosine biosynthesis protein TsaB
MLLAIDTSTSLVGIALYDGESVLAEQIWVSHQNHTIELAPALVELFKRCGRLIEDVQALGIATGPGSFTSLRVGLALVKGLALARHLPVMGIPTLEIIAAAQAASKFQLAAVIQAGRNRLAVGWYKSTKNGWQPTEPFSTMTADELANQIDKPTLVAGELSAPERQRLMRKYANVILASPANSVRRPAVLAELAWKNWQSGNNSPVESLAPIYLHSGEPIAV